MPDFSGMESASLGSGGAPGYKVVYLVFLIEDNREDNCNTTSKNIIIISYFYIVVLIVYFIYTLEIKMKI